MHIVLTVVGKDKVGIIAKVSALMAANGVNILNINQNILDGFFNMFLVGEMTNTAVPLKELQAKAVALGEEIGVEIRLQSEEIFTAMHKV